MHLRPAVLTLPTGAVKNRLDSSLKHRKIVPHGQEYCFVVHAEVVVDNLRIPATSPMMVSMRSIPARLSR
ncbi:hypothetical protein [Methanoculleus sp. 7T]|nr:hypothetical protein [Methanoculleus sp. 7T]MCK8519077.1 hypothetical protein [Methanoculleus sp. 7T]